MEFLDECETEIFKAEVAVVEQHNETTVMRQQKVWHLQNKTKKEQSKQFWDERMIKQMKWLLKRQMTAFSLTNKLIKHYNNVFDNLATEILIIDWVDNTTMEINGGKSIFYQTQRRFLKIVENNYVSADRPKIRSQQQKWKLA